MKRGGPLARRTPLRTQAPPRRTGWPTPPAGRATLAPSRRPPMTARPDGPERCQGPSRGAPRPCQGGLHRHHVIPRGRGGADEPDNLAWLCAWHHQWAHLHPLDARRLGLLA